jgi:hypothetical protein
LLPLICGADKKSLKRHAPAAADDDAEAASVHQQVSEDAGQPAVYFDASQHSNMAGTTKRQRKASYVANPIHQTGQKPKARQGATTRANRSRLAAMG